MTEPKSVVLPLHHGSIPPKGKRKDNAFFFFAKKGYKKEKICGLGFAHSTAAEADNWGSFGRMHLNGAEHALVPAYVLLKGKQ